MPLRVRVKPTRGGRYFFGLLLIVTFAAYNTSNNLIYLMLAVGLAALPAAAAVGLSSLRALSVRPAVAEDAYAGKPFQETLELRSRSRLFEAFGLSIDGKTKAPFVGAERKELVRTERLYPRRGVYRAEPVRLTSTHPLGLFEVARAVPREGESEIVVFPTVRAVDAAFLARDARGRGTGGAISGDGEDFYGLREYIRGDHVHHIHWKTSARVGDLMVKQLGRGRDERLLLALDRSGSRTDEDFEIVVSATASLASHLVSLGASFGFVSDDMELRPDGGRAHLRRVLTYLATVERSGPDPRHPSSGFRSTLESRARSGVRVLVFGPARRDAPGGYPPGVVTLDPERVLA